MDEEKTLRNGQAHRVFEMNIDTLKARYDIVGNDPKLQLAISKAAQVAPTDLSILITGESGVGKDVFSRIVHDNSNRKHKKLVSVNCGAIPEGTIESELFGHLKGSFTGADKDRKGYFEEANEGTIFLDEVGELPLQMQVKLLRVLENGEIIPVGSSTARKVNVRVVAATNVNIIQAIKKGRFREDLYYRLNQISISIPPLRDRKDDIHLLFRKFSSDVADRYKMPPIFLNEEAKNYLIQYPFYGNIRELKNITEQIAVVESERTITLPILKNYLNYDSLEVSTSLVTTDGNPLSDRELLLKVLSMGQMITEMRKEINGLKQVITTILQGNIGIHNDQLYAQLNGFTASEQDPDTGLEDHKIHVVMPNPISDPAETEEFLESEVIEDLPITSSNQERQAVIQALIHHGGKRKDAALELHISERTLYRKIKEFNITEKDITK